MDDAVKKLILMIDDEENVLTLNERVLTRASGGAVLCVKARTLAEARAAIRESARAFDLFILDIMLPDGSGLDFIKEIHGVSGAPILMLSARNTPKDIVEGAARGGDNYITKPYDPQAMAALTLAMLRREDRRGRPEPPKTIARGPLTLDLLAGRAYMDGVDAGLTPKEYALLLALVRNEGRRVSARSLYETVWQLPANNDTRTVKTHISKLRTKLSISEYSTLTITAGHNGGYRFDCALPRRINAE